MHRLDKVHFLKTENIGVILAIYFMNGMKERLNVEKEREDDRWNRFAESREQVEGYNWDGRRMGEITIGELTVTATNTDLLSQWMVRPHAQVTKFSLLI